VAGERYTLSAPAANLQDRRVQLNGVDLALPDGGELPRLSGVPTAAGDLTVAPASISFLALPQAGNSACR
jgi:hypothetical protein